MKKPVRSHVVLAILVSTGMAVSFAASPGEATYKAKCAMCHGATGTPSAGMAKMMGIKAASDPAMKALSEAQMVAAVKDGKGKMKPVSGLSDTEIKEVVSYFRTLR